MDADYPDNKLTGATFEVYKDVNGDGKLDDKIEDRVLSVLESNTQSRSDDMVLYLLVCNSYSNNENPIGKMPFEVVMKHYRELKLPHFESVRRIRQKIQATHPELGCLLEYRRNRKKMQKLYTDYARK